MKAVILCTSLTLALVGIGGARAQAPGPGYALQFSDNFTGGTVDTTKWNYRTDVKGHSAQLPANVRVDGNRLIVTPRKQSFAGMDFTSGGLVSKEAFRYGYYEVQAKTISDPGWHSSFWAMAGDGRTTYPMVARTEIDDFEIEGAAPEKISMGLLIWKGPKNLGSTRCNNSYMPGYSTAVAMHTYGFEWTESDVSYYLDGKKICSQPYPPTEGTHGLLNIWLTAMSSKPPVQASGHSPLTFAHVRYYIRDYYINAGETGYAEYGKDWKDGTGGGYSNLDTRQSCSADAVAMWSPTFLQAGNYDVEVWNDHGSSSADGKMMAVVTHKGVQTSKAISSSSGAGGWLDLGTFAFDQGAAGSLSLRSDKGGCVTAGMVKFVRK